MSSEAITCPECGIRSATGEYHIKGCGAARTGSTLKRTTPLRAQPRGKGNRGEREVINLLHKYGWTRARRNLQSGGQGGNDIVEGIPDVAIEVKRVERLNIWAAIAQCEAAAKPTDMPCVVFRRNGMPGYYAAVPFESLLELLITDLQDLSR